MNLKARYADPDPMVTVEQGREWARVHPKRCAQCGSVFYSFRPLDVEEWYPPHRVDPEPPLWTPPGLDPEQYASSTGMRGTCGDPDCHHKEQGWQNMRNPHYRKLLAAAEGTRETTPAPEVKLVKGGGLQRAGRAS